MNVCAEIGRIRSTVVDGYPSTRSSTGRTCRGPATIGRIVSPAAQQLVRLVGGRRCRGTGSTEGIVRTTLTSRSTWVIGQGSPRILTG